jgi:drug/metabolite transporter (DMT)-like permease
MTNDRPLFGILLMLGFCALIPFSDGIAKMLSGVLPLVMLMLVRFGAQALLLSPLVTLTGRSWRMSRRAGLLVIFRAVLLMLGMGFMYLSLRFLPLADAVAITFVMPFIMLVLGKYYLGEEVGPRRLIACCFGFVGTLMVIQPSFAAVGAPALLPLAVAVVFAVFMLVTRMISAQVDPITMQALSGIYACIVLGSILLFAPDLPDIRLVWPTGSQSILLATLAIVGTLAHLLMTWSLKFAPASTLAPMQYLEIPFATLIGWLFFGDLPNGLAAVGIAVTISTGLYIIHREHTAQRRVAVAA